MNEQFEDFKESLDQLLDQLNGKGHLGLFGYRKSIEDAILKTID